MAEQQALRMYEERTLTGEVEVVNRAGTGIKVAGEWVDYGDFYKGPRPERGQTVEVVAKGKYVRRIKILTPGALDAAEGTVELSGDELDGLTPPPAEPDDDPATWGYSGTGSKGAAPGSARRAAPAPQAIKAPAPAAKVGGRAAFKAAALAAAAHFLSGKPDATEDQVYETAYRFLAWLDADEA